MTSDLLAGVPLDERLDDRESWSARSRTSR